MPIALAQSINAGPCKMTGKRRIIFFVRFRLESDDQGILNSPTAVTEPLVIADACRASLAQLHIYPAWLAAGAVGAKFARAHLVQDRLGHDRAG